MISGKTLQMIGKYGFATVAACALSGVVYLFIIVPSNDERTDAREERKATMKAVLSTNQALLSTNQENSVSNRVMANSLKMMAESSETTQLILKRIEDGQTRGIWRATEPPKPEDLPKGVEPAK